MSSTYLSPSINFYKHMRSNNNGCISADLSSVGVREVGISFPLLSTLLAGLLLQHTLPLPLFASQVATTPIPVSLCLGSCIVGLKYRYSSWKEQYPEEQWSIFCHLHCCYPTQGRKHPLPLLLLVGLMSMCPLTTPTKSHPYKFNYCDQRSHNSQN